MLKIIIVTLSVMSSVYGNGVDTFCTDYQKNFEHKVEICHVPGGDDSQSFVKCVDYDGAKTHLGITIANTNPNSHSHKHHDYLGRCSSDEVDEVWMCNAGIKHEKHNSEHEVCIGNNCTSTIDTNHNFEFLNFDIADYFGEDSSGFSNVTVRASGSVDFNTASASLGDHVLSNVEFQLASERIGSEYFVDICWENKKNNNEAVTLQISNNIYGTQQGSSYLEMTSLEKRFHIKCSTTDSFSDLSYVSNTTYARQESFSMLGPVGLNNVDITNCVIRQFFRESRIAGREQRSNMLKAIRVSSNVKSNVQEDPEVDVKLRFCQVEKIPSRRGPPKFKCFNHNMNNDSLRNFLGTRKQRNKDYPGYCLTQRQGQNVACKEIYMGTND
ncbi:hypothetical protein A9Q84_02665 [Halobacteriovorax marinus]|uniref:Uncharacterized protein n=1 Tax=Halobacteriovorax marinus TaxID=97084 RepID=A0A1Y5FCM6_9BACT|nr:hypothetical protein A9Q84_02665 [Halobacteriovorax marinus]